MYTFKIFSDSSCDLSDQFYKDNDIGVIPFYVTFDKQNYFKEKVDINISDFYNRMKNDKGYPSTSLPTVSDYDIAFRPALQQGLDIICVCITSKFSGSYQSAVTAKATLADEFPDRKITIIDSMLATCPQGMLVSEIVKMRAAGLPYEEIVAKAEQQKESGRLIFSVDDLTYLQRGGRLGKASALIGGLLQIKPIIMLKDGELTPVAKIRGRGKAIQKIIEITLEYVGDNKDDYICYLGHAECLDEAMELESKMKEQGFSFDQPITSVGTTIGAHAGPSLIAVGVLKKNGK